MLQTYAPDFIADVGLKHRLAECQFSHLFKFDKQHIGSSKQFVAEDNQELQTTTSATY
jgi:hypothetical protein